MPLREFECEECGNRQEELIRNAQDEREVVCRVCGSARVARQLSAPSLAGGACDTGG